jgi:hypothetical protein
MSTPSLDAGADACAYYHYATDFPCTKDSDHYDCHCVVCEPDAHDELLIGSNVCPVCGDRFIFEDVPDDCEDQRMEFMCTTCIQCQDLYGACKFGHPLNADGFCRWALPMD